MRWAGSFYKKSDATAETRALALTIMDVVTKDSATRCDNVSQYYDILAGKNPDNTQALLDAEKADLKHLDVLSRMIETQEKYIRKETEDPGHESREIRLQREASVGIRDTYDRIPEGHSYRPAYPYPPERVPEDTARKLGGLFALPESGRVSVLVPEFIDGAEACWFLQGLVTPETWERIVVFGLDESRIHVQDYGGLMDYAIVGDLISKGGRISNNCFGLCLCRPPARDYGRKSRTEIAYLEPVARRLKAGGALCFIVREEISLREDFRKAFSRYFTEEAVCRLPEEKYRRVAIIACRKQKFSSDEGEAFELGKLIQSAEVLPEGDAAVAIAPVPVSDPDDIHEFCGIYDAQDAAKALAQADFPELFREMLFPSKNEETELQRSPQPPDEGKLIMLGTSDLAQYKKQ